MMTELEKKFMTLGCNFFGSQAKRGDFIEVHAIYDGEMSVSLINKRDILLIAPNDRGMAGKDAAGNDVAFASTIACVNGGFFPVTETYEQLKKMLI